MKNTNNSFTNSSSLRYCVTKKQNGSYGICGILNNKQIIDIEDVTTCLEKAQNIVCTLNKYQVSVYHFYNILEELME